MGLCSFTYHASQTKAGRFLDHFGMNMLAFFQFSTEVLNAFQLDDAVQEIDDAIGAPVPVLTFLAAVAYGIQSNIGEVGSGHFFVPFALTSSELVRDLY